MLYAQKHTIAIFFGDVIPVADCPNFAKIEEDSLPGFPRSCSYSLEEPRTTDHV